MARRNKCSYLFLPISRSRAAQLAGGSWYRRGERNGGREHRRARIRRSTDNSRKRSTGKADTSRDNPIRNKASRRKRR